jgi:hypothetical protein
MNETFSLFFFSLLYKSLESDATTLTQIKENNIENFYPLKTANKDSNGTNFKLNNGKNKKLKRELRKIFYLIYTSENLLTKVKFKRRLKRGKNAEERK